MPDLIDRADTQRWYGDQQQVIAQDLDALVRKIHEVADALGERSGPDSRAEALKTLRWFSLAKLDQLLR
jgi:hypothetical protein